MGVFIDLAVILVIVAVIAGIMRLLRQPLVIGYILTGIIIGQLSMGSHEILEVFSKIGIAVLLYIVGLHLSPKIIRGLGSGALIAGAAQIFITSIIGFSLMRLLGFSTVEAAYVGIGLSFSSTIVVLKLLGDRGELNKLHGRIAIGILLLQDIVASLLLVFVAASDALVGSTPAFSLLILLMKGILVLSMMYFLATRLVSRITQFSASSSEYLFIFAIAWGLGFAALFYKIGFSVEIGALLSGVMLSMTPYAREMSARLRPMRDFFVALFFVALGSSLGLSNPEALLTKVVLLTIFAVVGGTLIIYAILRVLHYSKRTSFFVGIALCQVSEFSLILLAVGREAGHVSSDTISLMTLVAIASIIVSSYLIMYASQVYPYVGKFLSAFSFFEEGIDTRTVREKYDAVLFGYHRAGVCIVDVYKKHSLKYIVVDIDPDAINRLKTEGEPHTYGDAQDLEFLEDIHLLHSKIVVSTVPDTQTNAVLSLYLKRNSYNGVVMVVASTVAQARELYDAGATYVLMPHHVGLWEGAKKINSYLADETYFEKEREHQESMLKKFEY